MAVVSWVLAAGLVSGAGAQPMSPHHGFLGGPWEVLAKMGHEGAAIRLPVSVRDESKPQEMSGMLPVMATPITVRVKRYLPNLAWETAAVEDPNGGAAAKVSLRGESLQQDLWLCARDRERQSISAHIGGVAIKELPAGRLAGEAMENLKNPENVGILLVWLGDADAPLVYAVRPGQSISLPDSDWKLSVLRYLPHYSIDRDTRKITNLSDQPVNPAAEVRVEGGGRQYSQWLWSQFDMSPHKMHQLPFRARFLDFDVGGASGQYILAVTHDLQSYLVHLKDGKRTIERVELDKRYSFKDERYWFAIEELRGKAGIVDQWKNASETLLRPAIVAEIVQGTEVREVVLELGKPCHHRTALGTLVVLYRRIPEKG
jgi:hypothetical protein